MRLERRQTLKAQGNLSNPPRNAMDVRAGFSCPETPSPLCLSRLALNSSSHHSFPGGNATPPMPTIFPPVRVAPESAPFAPLVRSLSSAHPAGLASPSPAAHPGQLAPEWLPRRGTVRPDVAPKPLTAPTFDPTAVGRGLGWGIAFHLATEWLESMDREVKGISGFYMGDPFPETSIGQTAQCMAAVARACVEVDAETRPQTAPQAMPKGNRVQTEVDERTQERPQRRWKVWARSRAGKSTRTP